MFLITSLFGQTVYLSAYVKAISTAKDKIVKLFSYKLCWRTNENKLKTGYEQCHKFSEVLPNSLTTYVSR